MLPDKYNCLIEISSESVINREIFGEESDRLTG